MEDVSSSTSRQQSSRNAISDIQGQLFPSLQIGRERSRSRDRRDDPLGLTVLYTPETDQRMVDIVFIHGLGGTSLRTWCRNRELEFLWPKLWLPKEGDLSRARILTFGYNAQFSRRGQQAALSINDFAADLLYSMKYGSDDNGEKLGQVPIIIVAHSMGGLVFKKAFIQGQLNQEYRQLMSNIKSVLFLATPHRGTDLAKTLNRVLSSSVFGHTSKDYVTELTRNSITINELNDSFRHHASKLEIFSFYETLGTQIGPMNVLILEKQSSLLGYENETVKPLNANHHDVCKFTDPNDSNYRSVRDALRSIVSSLRSSVATSHSTEKELDILQRWLGVGHAQDDDLSALRSIRKAGTCEDLVKLPEFENWLFSDRPHVLWAHAPPGNGKSVQCSFVIDSLKSHYKCVHWFFRYGYADKQQLANMFRSVAYQIANSDAAFCRSLVEQAKSGTQVNKSDAATTWRLLFATRLSMLNYNLFWVIDGLDESDSSRTLIDLMSNIGQSDSKIRVLFFSRPQVSISYSFQRARKRVQVTEITLRDNLKDIRLAATDELEEFPASDEFKQLVVDEITERSQGNFLWTSLVLKHILRCFRPEDVRRVLRDSPDGMDELYGRMADTITKIERDADKRLCRILLSWATYSIRPLTVDELKAQYPAELDTFLDMSHLIGQICGEFAFINRSNQLALVHQTAQEYLRTTKKLGFSLESSEANKELLATCLKSLSELSANKVLRGKLSPFLSYSSVYWGFHLDHCSAESDDVLEMLFMFLSSDLPLPWIHKLALVGQLSTLVKASSSLTTFIAAKFGSHLSENPEAIYTCIPALSPENSVIFQNFSKKPAVSISLSGLSNMDWDDCLARVSSGVGQALHVTVSSELLAVAIRFPPGRTTIRFWVESPRRERAMALEFAADESFIIVATNLRRVYRLDLKMKNPSWTAYDSALLKESFLPEGAFVNSPSSLAFNEDCTQLAVAYREFPLAIWNLDPPKVLARSRRKQKQGHTTSNTWTGVNRVVWHPFNGQVLGIYRDGNIFKWGPNDNTHVEVKQELDATPSEIRCSYNGTVFATSDVRGSIKIYDYSQMVLIYKLTSDDIINSIAFSPDSRRFYDLRGSYYNVWEPNCLLRTVEAGMSEDSESTYSSEPERRGSLLTDLENDEDDVRSTSLTLDASEAQVENRLTITEVATCFGNQQLCAYARDEGIIEIYDMSRDSRHVIAQTMFGMGVHHVTLSQRGNCIAYSTQDDFVHVKNLELLSDLRKIKIETVYSAKHTFSRGSISQLLIDYKLQIIRLITGIVIAEATVEPTEQPARWETHPADLELLLAFTAGSVRAYSWRNLELKYTIPVDITNTNDNMPASSLTMEFLLPSYHLKLHLAIVSSNKSSSKYFTFLILDTTALGSATSQDTAIRTVYIPPSIADEIERPLGVLQDGRLAFLDEDLWADGTLLCPSRGEMAVVKSEIGLDW
ncbi:hypothetical protein F4782DRAFT_539058 [Xylaria castorea]|nr:hypothetical protein F4782DRAFT_539058 [Xylaria castorea]